MDIEVDVLDNVIFVVIGMDVLGGKECGCGVVGFFGWNSWCGFVCKLVFKNVYRCVFLR